MKYEHKKIITVCANLLSILIVFFVIQVPQIVWDNTFYEAMPIEGEYIQYALKCLAWFIFLPFLGYRVVKIAELLLKNKS